MMEVEVKKHKSHSKHGKEEEVREHKMEVNPKVHKHHIKRIKEEIKELEEDLKGERHKKHEKVAYA